ncbi:MAG: PilZ domain-containing protein [Spirochaetales bacterium]|nr:PilZ domain-containing protein [Spirochaetales bacterium]
MKTVIVSQDDDLIKHLSFHLAPLEFQLTHFNDALSLLESVDMEYDLVIFDVSHFPRHWKPLVKLIREKYTKEQTVIILIKASEFPFEEAAKAIYLGVNGIVDYNPKDKQEVFRLTEIFKRYRSLEDHRRFLRVIPVRDELFSIIFTNPKNYTLVTGTIRDISIQGMMFRPLHAEMVSGLEVGDMVSRCSLQVGVNLLSLDCKITRIDREVGLEFTYFNDNAHHRLFTYLMERPDRFLEKEFARKPVED